MVSQYFIDREVMLVLRDQGVIAYDGDSARWQVSNTRTAYPGAELGWMVDAVGVGYQAAMVDMHSLTYGRLGLSVKQHLGSVVSFTQAEVLMRAAEDCTGVRPRWRPELLAERTAQQRTQFQATETKLAHYEGQVTEAEHRMAEVECERFEWQQRVAALSTEYQAMRKLERPYGRLA